MGTKTLPEHKRPAADLESVRVFRDNIAALLGAAQSTSAPRQLTQAEFAKLAKMSLRTLRNLLNGEHAATLRTIERAAKGLHLETWQLLFPDFPAELALNERFRDQTQDVVRRYIKANETIRTAIADLLPQPASTNSRTAT